VELRLDLLCKLDAQHDLPVLLAGTRLPVIVTLRAKWEGGGPHFCGTEESRLQALWLAVSLGAAFVDVELKASSDFFSLAPIGWTKTHTRTRFILSSHDFIETPSLAILNDIHAAAVSAGADIVKIATTCLSILDIERLETLLATHKEFPTAALGMGQDGLVCFLRASLV
jgi:3-dehydroquinate dehydratase/shikimate dehydrogenase